MGPTTFMLLMGGGVRAATATEHMLGALLGVGAGRASLICWRAQGRAFDAWMGSMLVSAGVLLIGAAGIPALSLSQLGPAQPFDLLVLAVTATYFADKAATSPVLGRAALGAASALWAIATVSAATKHRQGRAVPPWSIMVVALLGVDTALRAVILAPQGWDSLAIAVVPTTAFALALVATTSELDKVLRHQDRRALTMHVDLDRLATELEDERRDLEERLHDLRNAVSALRSADHTLRHYAARLDPSSRRSLGDAMSAELSRLQALIEPGRPARLVDFDVARALAPVLTAERNLGAVIDVQVAAVSAHGDPMALAQVVQNLLVNARRYAPDCRVTVSGTASAGRVQLLVADTGPGIAEHERTRVFLRGTRGSTAAGTAGDGLGLHVATRLLATFGGSIQLVDGRTSGACFLIELPASDRSGQPLETVPSTLDGLLELNA
ncbi:MAG: HAMP domain-containing sensor histidine kinase [Actinomycetota bacterium]|nr:HAMP domain-containing sensor histidine kinase [Actinomycetota bacterium]